VSGFGSFSFTILAAVIAALSVLYDRFGMPFLDIQVNLPLSVHLIINQYL
jgi:hypothetical protein